VKHYLRILANHSRPGKFLAARLLTKTGACRLLTIRQDGYRLRYFPTNLSEQAWINPGFRTPALHFFNAFVAPGDRIVDVGANVGDVALTCARRAGPTGQVWAIEAHPRTYRYLLSNLDLNQAKTVVAINHAVGAEPGSIAFEDNRRDDMNRIGENGIMVELRRLDDLIPQGTSIDLLKIDVEGFELAVLRGAPTTLAATGTVFIEVGDDLCRHFGHDVGDVLGQLEGAGVQLFVGNSRSFRAIDRHFRPERVIDVIATRDPSALAARTGWIRES